MGIAVVAGACALDVEGQASQGGASGAGAAAGQPSSGTGDPTGSGAMAASGGGGTGGATPVGNCVLDPGEACDDCNVVGGDGCDVAGQVEAGWICAEPGEPCNHVSGVDLASGPTTAEIGNQAEQPPFVDTCAPGTVLVGVAASDSGDWPGGGEYLSFVSPHCAAPVVDASGHYTWQSSEAGDVHGGAGDCCVQNTTMYPLLVCPNDRFVAGFRAWTQSNKVTGITLLCRAMSFDTSAASVADPTQDTGAMGSGAGTESNDVVCPSGMLATSLVGSAGAVIDRVGMGCATPSASICGDGSPGGAEACDDGNAVCCDGCSPLCDLE